MKNLEARKLSLIERFMKFRQESAIDQLEIAMTQIEMNSRLEASWEDVENDRVRSYESFSKDIQEWIASRKNTK